MAILMYMIGLVGEQGPHYIPLSLIINTKYIVPNSMHCLVLQSCLLGRYGSSKRKALYAINLHFTLMTPPPFILSDHYIYLQ